LWGKGLLNGRRTAGAARVLERLARRFPQHRLADDALLLAAQAWRRAGDPVRARGALARLLREMPRGDMAPKARFEMARLAARVGNLDEAARRFAAIADEEPYPSDGHLRGRPLYALGRLRERQGNRAAALRAYRRCAVEHPLTYWAALARGRLRAAGEEPREDSRGALPAETNPRSLPWPPLPPALAASKTFARGAALIRLGAGDLAAPEMARASREAGRTEQARAALSLVYHLAGDWHRSHWIIRRRLGHLLARPPTPDSWRLLLLAYPLGFREVVEPVARRFRVDPLLLTALVREESAFNPTIESWANAVGLSQLIWPTAQRIARALRIRPFRREMLLDPEINLRIGAKYLANLLRRFRGSPPLAIAGYNAGERAVDRWLRERGDAALDRFVDAIPYEQTRHYTRRVLESYATYKYLYGGPGERFLALGPGRAPGSSR
jgi:soluble lytic murein transglycosylase